MNRTEILELYSTKKDIFPDNIPVLLRKCFLHLRRGNEKDFPKKRKDYT